MLADHEAKLIYSFQRFQIKQSKSSRPLSRPLPPCQIRWTTQRQFGVNRKTHPVFATAIEMQTQMPQSLSKIIPLRVWTKVRFTIPPMQKPFHVQRENTEYRSICATLPENLDQGTREHLIAQGVAPMQGIHECLNAIAAAAWWSQRKSELSQRPIAPRLPPSPPRSGSASYMTEAAAKAILEAAAFPIPKGHLISRDSAERVAHTLGGHWLSKW